MYTIPALLSEKLTGCSNPVAAFGWKLRTLIVMDTMTSVPAGVGWSHQGTLCCLAGQIWSDCYEMRASSRCVACFNQEHTPVLQRQSRAISAETDPNNEPVTVRDKIIGQLVNLRTLMNPNRSDFITMSAVKPSHQGIEK